MDVISWLVMFFVQKQLVNLRNLNAPAVSAFPLPRSAMASKIVPSTAQMKTIVVSVIIFLFINVNN